MTTPRPLPEPRRYKATARLEPIAQALLQRGYTQTRDGQGESAFGPTKDGYLAVFAEPLDIDWIRTQFLLPPSVRYDAAADELYDTETYTSIQGSQPSPP